MEPLDRRIVARAVAAHAGDRGVGGGARAWTCERHLKSLLFAQWAGLSSLREIVTGVRAHSPRFYHLNLRAPCRLTRAEANADRPAAVFHDIAMAAIPVAGVLRRESEALLCLLDASPIPLKDDRIAWAEANTRTRGLKLHLLYDPRQRRPVWFDVTSAKLNDVVAGRSIPLEAGATPAFAWGRLYVFDKGHFDKGYNDFRWWSEIAAVGAYFVTRRKHNTYRRDVVEHTATGEGILADRRLKIGHRQPRGGAPINPLYEVERREIILARPDKEEPLDLLTNDLQRPAIDITRLYKERWDIERLFKWLKQNLKIRRFPGRSENAVRPRSRWR